MKTEIRTDLLRKLADHLINGQLGHEKFDFGKYNDIDLTILETREMSEVYESNENFLKERNYCGTNGCAIGECPIVFPDEWCFTDGLDFYSPILRSQYEKGKCDEKSSAIIFFNISSFEFSHLFFPDDQLTDWGNRLNVRSSKEEVAKNIIQFCDLADQGKLYN